MRNTRLLIAALLVVGTLAACTTPPDVPPPSSSARSDPTSRATPAAVELPTVEEMLGILSTGPNDDVKPTASLGAVLEPGQPQFLEDARPDPFGMATVRVACSSEDGSNVTLTLSSTGIDPVTFEAPCGAAPSTVTSQSQTHDFTASYRFDVVSDVRAVVAVGMVPGVQQ